jgi:hypothetical protein
MMNYLQAMMKTHNTIMKKSSNQSKDLLAKDN